MFVTAVSQHAGSSRGSVEAKEREGVSLSQGYRSGGEGRSNHTRLRQLLAQGHTSNCGHAGGAQRQGRRSVHGRAESCPARRPCWAVEVQVHGANGG